MYRYLGISIEKMLTLDMFEGAIVIAGAEGIKRQITMNCLSRTRDRGLTRKIVIGFSSVSTAVAMIRGRAWV
jgi:hypothetical protein